MDIKIVDEYPSAEDYNYLRAQVGWGQVHLDRAKTSLLNSLYSVSAYHNDGLIGMGRIIGDKGLYYYIQDVIVLPEYQGHGIGRKIMHRLMKFIHQDAGANSIIALMSASGKEEFYELFGFIKRPNDQLGCGMSICI